MQHDSPNLDSQTLKPENSFSAVSNSISLLDYVEIIVKHWKLIAGITISVTLATVIYVLCLPNIYTAKTKILPPQQGGGLLSAAMMQGAFAAAVGAGDLGGLVESKSAKLYSEMLTIESLRDPIIERFKLQEVYRKKYREDVYKILLRKVTIQAGKEGIITISVDDTDPKRAADIGNAFVDELRKLTMQMSMTGASNSKAFLEERIKSAQSDLKQAEGDLKSFQAKYKTLDATQQATVSASAIAQLTGQLTSQEIQLGILRRTYVDTSQEVKSLMQSIKVLKAKIAELQNFGAGSVLPGFEQIPERGQEYLHLMRKFKTAEAVYDVLVRQYEMARLNAENDVSTIQVIQKAMVPGRKSKPARAKMVLLGMIASILTSIIAALLIERLSINSNAIYTRLRSAANFR